MTSGFDLLERELRQAEARLVDNRARRHGTPLRLRVAGGAVAAGGVLVAIAVVVVALVALRPAEPSTGPAGATGLVQHYSDPEGWSIAFPDGFDRTTRGQFPQQTQVTLSSFSPSRLLKGRLRRGTALEPDQLPFEVAFDAPLGQDGRFPSDGVALILQSGRFTAMGADSRFPIKLDSLHPRSTAAFFSGAARRHAALPQAQRRVIVGYSKPVTATVLIGSHASTALKNELAAMISSLKFAVLRPGSQVGLGVVLGPAAAYPVGSFTRVKARFAAHRAVPIYVVHAPGRLTYGHGCGFGGPCVAAGSFYGIGGSYNTRQKHAPACAIRLDAYNRVFYCANLAVRWDRVGRVISRPADESYIGSIEGLYAKVCWDGQLMISPGFGPQLSRAAVHQLWPGWRQPNEPLSR